MTKTESLIDRLAAEGAEPLAPRPGGFVLPILGSAVLCLAALRLVLGPPLAALPDIGAAPYVMKLAFALSVALLGIFGLHAAGVPGRRLTFRISLLSVPFVALSVLVALEAAAAAPGWPGETWLRCLAAIGLLGTLAFAGMLAALRSLAPTRLGLAGGLAGISAGGVAASAYGFWCPESTAVFLFGWYVLPMLALGIAGALLGPRWLRW